VVEQMREHEPQGVMSGAAKDRLARRLYRDYGLVNSSALVVILPEDEDYEVVATAASHVSPRYPYSAEAPMVYGDEPVTLAMWRGWVESVVED
jgi:hypothetical protein